MSARALLLALGLCAGCGAPPQPAEALGHLARLDDDDNGFLDAEELADLGVEPDQAVRCSSGSGQARLDAAGLLCVARSRDPNDTLHPYRVRLPLRDAIQGGPPTREQRELLSLLRFLAGELPEGSPHRPGHQEIATAAATADPGSPAAQALLVRMRVGFEERGQPFPDALIAAAAPAGDPRERPESPPMPSQTSM